MPRVVLLPGLDGSGQLFREFTRAAPPSFTTRPVALPPELADYGALTAWAQRTLTLDAQTILLAESFSGPLATRLAADCAVAALVLVNTCVVAPYPAHWQHAVVPCAFAVPLPDAAMRARLVGPAAPASLIAEVRAAIMGTAPRVLARRLRALLAEDARPALQRVAASGTPVIDLRSTDDRLMPERASGAIRAALMGGRYAELRVPGPHLLLQAAPASVWAALEPQLRAMADSTAASLRPRAL